MRKTSARLMRWIRGAFVALLAMGMALGVALPARTALADQAAVRDAANGVMKFNWYDPDGNMYGRGSCFLINEDTVVTGYHCTFWSTAELDAIDKALVAEGQDPLDRRWLKEHMTYSVNVNRDMQIGATLVNRSEEQDFAIFKLDQSIAGYTPLTFRDSSTVEAAESIYSVGFPANSDLSVIQRYTPADATIKGGTVSKEEDIYQGMTVEGFRINGYFIQSDCAISGGDSGGPMVDSDGHVVGISVWGNDSFYFAVASDRVMEALNTLKIDYNTTDEVPVIDGDDEGDDTEAIVDSNSLTFSQLSTAIGDAQGIKADGYTEDSYAALQAALDEAIEVRDSTELVDDTDAAEYREKQAKIDDAAANLKAAVSALAVQEDTGMPTWAIIAIIAGVAVLIGIIVAIVLINRNKKKSKNGNQPAGDNQNRIDAGQVSGGNVATGAGPSAVGNGNDSPGTTVLGDNGTETTVLGADETSTTILGEQINGGTLTRMSTNEQIPISRSDMTLGRERKSVDYCIEGNNNIGRVHVRIVARDGNVYIIDNNSTNGTYVNNTKLRAGQEQVLHDNDIVRLADEKFRYTS